VKAKIAVGGDFKHFDWIIIFIFWKLITTTCAKIVWFLNLHKCRISVRCTHLRFSCTWIGRSLMYSRYEIQPSFLCVAKDRGLRSIQSDLLARADGLPSTTEKKKNLNTANLFIPIRALVLDASIRSSIISKFKQKLEHEQSNPRTPIFWIRKISSVNSRLIRENRNILKHFDDKICFLGIHIFISLWDASNRNFRNIPTGEWYKVLMQDRFMPFME